MTSPPLHDFIAHARNQGMDYATIRVLLLSAGWKEKDIAAAMTAESLQMSVPPPPDVGGARDAFFHLLTFVAFYTAAISLVLLFFQFINRLLPDPALETYWTLEGQVSVIRWLLAQVIVGFPLFVFLWSFLLKEVRQRPEKAASAVRRWLTYLTLFVAAATLMGTLITLLYYFLEGELTARFGLKVLVVLMVAGLTLIYFILSLRIPADEPPPRLHRGFAMASTGIVAAALIWGMVVVGNPLNERSRKFDQRKREQLQAIASEMERVVLEQSKEGPAMLRRPLPKDLTELLEVAEYQRPEIHDPQTGEPYEYTVLGEGRYQLCATFNFQRQERFHIFWNHPAGRHCFEFNLLEPDANRHK